MHQPPQNLLAWIGFVTWGDLHDVTIYRNKKGKVVMFSKTWPKKPPSPEQIEWRTKYTNAAALWRALPPTARHQWHLATRRASLTMTGYNLFVHYVITHDEKAIRTLERQTGTTLL